MARPRSEEAHRHILDAALSLLIRGRPLSAEALAARAGVSRSMVYSRFGSMQGVRDALLAERGLALDGADPLPSTQTRILDAALALVAQHGVAQLTVAAVADAAGVSVATVYAHTQDRAGLLDALAAHTRPDAAALLAPLQDLRVPLVDALQDTLAAMAAQEAQHRRLWLALRERGTSPWDAVLPALGAALAARGLVGAPSALAAAVAALAGAGPALSAADGTRLLLQGATASA